MNQVTKTMSGIVTGMDKALQAMDIETVSHNDISQCLVN